MIIKKRDVIIVLVILLLLICCSKKQQNDKFVLLSTNGKKIEEIKLKKIIEFDFLSRWCIPLPKQQKIICDEIIKFPSKFRIKEFNMKGKLLKKSKIITWGRGPEDVYQWYFDKIWLTEDEKLMFIDGRNYLKELNPFDFKIRTIMKISNKIKQYMKEFDIIGENGGVVLESYKNLSVTTFTPTVFCAPDISSSWKFFIVKFRGLFDDFKIIKKVKMSQPPFLKKNYTKTAEGKINIVLDRYKLIRRTRFIAVDWKMQQVYYIPDIQNNEILKTDFEGETNKRYKLDIDLSRLSIDKKEIKKYCKIERYQRFKMLKRFKNKFNIRCYIPKKPPFFLGIKIFGDSLWVISSIKDIKKANNKVYVYKIPSMKYKGFFYIPLPKIWIIKKWVKNYYIVFTLNDYGNYRIIIYRINIGRRKI